MLQTGLFHIEANLCVLDGNSLLLFEAELSLCFRELCLSAYEKCSLSLATYCRLSHELSCRASQLLYTSRRQFGVRLVKLAVLLHRIVGTTSTSLLVTLFFVLRLEDFIPQPQYLCKWR